MLKDPEPGVRLAAAYALRMRQADEAKDAVDPLIELLAHEKADVRRDTALALGEFGAAAKKAVEPLKNVQQKATESAVRSAAAWAAARIIAADAHCNAVAVIVQSLKDGNPAARLEAAQHLGMLGADARTACDALNEAKMDDDELVRRAATEALSRINVKPAVAAGHD